MIVLEDNNFIPVECPHCKSKIGVHLNDIIYHEMHSAPYTARCGACHGTVNIREQTIPTAWIAKIVDE